MLSYGCLFLALDRFAQGGGAGLPTAELDKISHYILSGGAAQTLSEQMASRMIKLLVSKSAGNPAVTIDRSYQVWVEGITWSGIDEE